MSAKSKSFAGRAAAATGAKRGAGRDIAIGGTRRGADVAFNYRQSAETAEPFSMGLTNRLNHYLNVLAGVEALVLRSALLLLLIIAVVKLILKELG